MQRPDLVPACGLAVSVHNRRCPMHRPSSSRFRGRACFGLGGILAVGAMLGAFAHAQSQPGWMRAQVKWPRSSYSAIAYDVARRRVVLFGGLDSYSAFADTWEWD